MPKKPYKKTQLLYEPLESRLLFSATADVALLDDGYSEVQYLLDTAAHTPLHEALDFSSDPDEFEPLPAELPAEDEPQRQLVFVDSSIENYDLLVADILAQYPEQTAEIIMLEAGSDGVDQISDVLATRAGVEAVHIVSHGAPGEVTLGNTTLTQNTLPLYTSDLQAWAQSLTAGADILFYGCNLAGSAEGIALLNEISDLTETDVAASDDLTGNGELGGDWILEFQRGEVQTTALMQSTAAISWAGVLATPVAADDSINVWFDETITGNLITGVGGPDMTADALGDGTTDIKSVTYDGVVYDTWVDDKLTITADSGTFVIQRDGTFIYTATADGVRANPFSDPTWHEAYSFYTFAHDTSYENGSGQFDVTNASGTLALTDKGLGIYSTGADNISLDFEHGGASSEALAIDLGATYNDFYSRLHHLSASETVYWEAYDENNISVGSGSFTGTADGTVNISGIGEFQTVVFTAEAAQSYRVLDVTATNNVPAADVFTYVIQDDDSPTPEESSATLTIGYFNDDFLGYTNYVSGSPSGTFDEGDILEADAVWDPNNVGGIVDTVDYQWQRSADGLTGWQDIDGATSTQYVISQADVGQYLRYTGTHTDSWGTIVTVNPALAVGDIRSDTDDPDSIGDITGTTTEGETLTTGAISDPDGTTGATPTYQWQRSVDGTGNWIDITGATGSTYTLGAEDAAEYVRVTARYTDDGGNDEWVASNATARIDPLVTPYATDDTSNIWFGETITGNLLDGTGGAGIHSDYTGVGTTDIKSITYDGVVYDSWVDDALTISADSGIFTIQRDGTYTFNSTAAHITANPMSDPAWQETYDIHVFHMGDSYVDGSGNLDLVTNAGPIGDLYESSSGLAVVNGNSTGDNLESNGSGESEAIAIDFGSDYTHFNVITTLQAGHEDFKWEAFDSAGNAVGTGTYNGIGSDPFDYSQATVDVGTSFRYVVFSNANADETTRIYEVTGFNTAPADEVFTYQIEDDANDTSTANFTLRYANDNEDGRISYSPEASTEGATITASAITDADGAGPHSYQWQRSSTGNGGWENISGATGASYTLASQDVNQFIRVTATYTDNEGTIENVAGFALGAIANTSADAGSISISGSETEGETLTATVPVDTDGDGSVSSVNYQWQTSSNGSTGWSNITGATASSYDLTDADSGQYIRVTATYVDNTGDNEWVASSATGQITDVNFAPILGADEAVDVAENTTTVGTYSASDTDASDTVTYSLTGDDAGLFSIDAAGNLAFTSGRDFETPTDTGGNNIYNVTVVATDNGAGSLSDTQNITITLTDDNSEFTVGAVTDSNGSVNSVSESAANTSTVGITASASDGDGSDDITYSLSDNAGGRFSIDETTGVVSVADNSLLDYETAISHDITILATSDDGSTSSETFTISIADDTSEFSVGSVTDNNGSGNSISESAANTSTMGITASASDGDGSDDITYSLQDDAGGAFTIDASTGVVTVLDNTQIDYETSTSLNITVRATSDDGSTRDQVFSITITDADEFNVGAVTDSNAGANTLSEGASNGATVGITASATDADGSNNSITYSLSDDAGGRFTIDASTGVVTVANDSLLDYETDTSHDITVLATSADTSTSSQSFTVNMTDVDEFDVGAVTDSDASANTVTESASNGTAVGIMANAVDNDGSATVTYSLTDDAGGRFTIDTNSGAVSVADASLLDYETDSSHAITVLATSADGSSSSEDFVISLTDVNEFGVGAISDNNAAANEISESASNGTAVGITALASDADGTNNTITYSLSDNAGNRFAIDANSGVITIADSSLLDYENTASHTVTVVASSSDGSTSTADFTISLTDFNEFAISAISDTDAAPQVISENSSNGAFTGFVAYATDGDAGDAVTYSLTDDAGGRFSIDSATGRVTVLDASLLDYETDTSHQITVRATSTDTSYAELLVSISLTDADEGGVGPVMDTNTAVNQIAENAANDDLVGITANASDVDATDTVTYALDDSAGGRFQIDATTGVVSVADASLLDYETDTSHNISVRATSSDGSTSAQDFTVNVLDISETQVTAVTDSNDTANRVMEDGSSGNLTGITAFADDYDATDTVTFSLSDNAGGRFDIDPNSGVVTVVDFNLLDYETETQHNITVQATSSDGSTSTQTFSIAIEDANEFDLSPITDIDATANEVSEAAAIGSLVGVAATANDADGTNNGVTYSLSDNADGRFSIDATTGVITTAAVLDYENAISHSITVLASSADGSTSTQDFTIEVVNNNEAPETVTGIAEQTATEDSPFVFVVPAATFSDPDGNPLTLTVTTQDGAELPAWLSFDASTGTFSGTPGQTDAGVVNLTLTAADAGGLSAGTELTIVASAVNDAPTSTGNPAFLTQEDAIGDQFNLYSLFADEEDSTADLQFSVISSSNPELLSSAELNQTEGTLSFAYTADAFGEAQVQVRATDSDGAFVDATITVTVAPVNDTPVALTHASIEADSGIKSGSAIDLKQLFHDVEDGTNVTFTLVGNSNPDLIKNITINPDTREMGLSYNPQSVGQAILVVRATDSEGAWADTEVTLTVTQSDTTLVVEPSQPTPVTPSPEPEVEPAPNEPEPRQPITDSAANDESFARGNSPAIFALDQALAAPPAEAVSSAAWQEVITKQQNKQKAREAQNPQLSVANRQEPLPTLLAPGMTGLNEDDIANFVNELRKVRSDINQTLDEDEAQKQLYAGITVSLTTGVVVWGLRAGSLLFTLFSMMPLWKGFDPLPVVDSQSRKERERRRKDREAEDRQREEVGHMFDSGEKR